MCFLAEAKLRLCSVLRDGNSDVRGIKESKEETNDKHGDQNSITENKEHAEKPSSRYTLESIGIPAVIVEVLPVAGEWDSQTITWENQLPSQGAPFQVASFQIREQSVPLLCFEIDVTSAFAPSILALATSSEKKFITFKIFNESTKSVYFKSGERMTDSDDSPELLVYIDDV